jgi:hypothetical protein
MLLGHYFSRLNSAVATVINGLAASPHVSSDAIASLLKRSARWRLSGNPRRPGYVSFPRAASLPTRFPVISALPETSSRSSMI